MRGQGNQHERTTTTHTQTHKRNRTKHNNGHSVSPKCTQSTLSDPRGELGGLGRAGKGGGAAGIISVGAAETKHSNSKTRKAGWGWGARRRAATRRRAHEEGRKAAGGDGKEAKMRPALFSGLSAGAKCGGRGVLACLSGCASTRRGGEAPLASNKQHKRAGRRAALQTRESTHLRCWGGEGG